MHRRLLQEGHTDLKQFLDRIEFLFIQQEQNQVITIFDENIVMRHDDFIATDDGAYGSTFRQLDLFDSFADNF